MDMVQTQPWVTLSKRRVQHYGHAFDYVVSLQPSCTSVLLRRLLTGRSQVPAEVGSMSLRVLTPHIAAAELYSLLTCETNPQQ